MNSTKEQIENLVNKKKDFIINQCFNYYNDVKFGILDYTFSHIMLSNILYITNVLKNKNIFYVFSFEECRGENPATSTRISAFVLYITYEYENVSIKLSIPIDYLLMFCTHFLPLHPVLNNECPICLESFQKCFQCSRCGRCTCQNCYYHKIEHNTKCPLCNFDLKESPDVPVRDSYTFLHGHPVDYEKLLSRILFCNFGEKVIDYTLVGTKPFSIRNIITAYHDIMAET